MERLREKYNSACKALQTLEEIIQDYERNKIQSNIFTDSKINHEKFVKYLRDSLIQRFEYTFDIFWKYMKLYLERVEGIKFEVSSPKRLFRQLFQLEFIDENQTKIALKMVDHRNLTTHTYHEGIAEDISNQIPIYFKLIQHILNKASI